MAEQDITVGAILGDIFNYTALREERDEARAERDALQARIDKALEAVNDMRQGPIMPMLGCITIEQSQVEADENALDEIERILKGENDE